MRRLNPDRDWFWAPRPLAPACILLLGLFANPASGRWQDPAEIPKVEALPGKTSGQGNPPTPPAPRPGTLSPQPSAAGKVATGEAPPRASGAASDSRLQPWSDILEEKMAAKWTELGQDPARQQTFESYVQRLGQGFLSRIQGRTDPELAAADNVFLLKLELKVVTAAPGTTVAPKVVTDVAGRAGELPSPPLPARPKSKCLRQNRPHQANYWKS